MKPITAVLLFLLSIVVLTAHDHFEAGVAGANPGLDPQPDSALAFVGKDPEARIFHLLPRPKGFRPAQRCGGYYMLNETARSLFPNDAFSLTALSSGVIEEAAAGHAHPGSQIWAEIVSVSGPQGASFGFWDEYRDLNADTPSVSFTTGLAFAPHAFLLSEGPDFEDEDPQGHIHNRSWTATHPGEYRVGIRLVDRSTNRSNGQPWHAPSRVYTFRFLACPDFQPVLACGEEGVRLTWPSRMGTWDAANQTGIVFTVLRNTSLSTAGWESIGTTTGTTAETATFLDPSPPRPQAFYRLSYDWGNTEP